MSIEKVQVVIENGRAKIERSPHTPLVQQSPNIAEIKDLAKREARSRGVVYGEVDKDLIANIRITHPGPTGSSSSKT